MPLSPAGRPRASRRTRLGSTLAALVGLAALAGCQATPQLNMSRHERMIDQQLETAYPSAKVAEADCPEPSAVSIGKGIAFTCTATVDGASVRFTVTQTDDLGDVTYRQVDAVVDIAPLAQRLQDDYRHQRNASLAVDCGPKGLRAVEVGTSITCAGRLTDGTNRPITVTVTNLAGDISWTA